MRIAHERAAQREHVVQVVRRVLRHAERPVPGEEEVHLRRRLGARRHLEHHVDAVDGLLLPRAHDVDGRRDQRDGSQRRRLPQPRAHLAARSLRQQRAVHVCRAARHRTAGVDVLADRVLEEALRREDRDAARRDVLLGHDAARAAEVVDVAVGVQQSGHRPLAAMLAIQRQRGGRRLRGDQRVDHQDARVALDDRHVRQVEAAHLVDALGDLEQAVNRVQLPLPPEARIHRLRTVGVEEAVGVRIPDDAPVRRADDAVATASRSGRAARRRSPPCPRTGAACAHPRSPPRCDASRAARVRQPSAPPSPAIRASRSTSRPRTGPYVRATAASRGPGALIVTVTRLPPSTGSTM